MAGRGESGAEPARRRAACRIGGLLGALLPPAARRRALAEAAITGEWASIVGPELAARCTPIALRGGAGGRGGATLELAVAGAAALELQHTAPQLVERINAHLGWRAVGRLLLRQRRMSPEGEPAAADASAGALDPGLERAIEAELAGLEAAELRAALGGLGRTLLAGRRRRR